MRWYVNLFVYLFSFQDQNFTFNILLDSSKQEAFFNESSRNKIATRLLKKLPKLNVLQSTAAGVFTG
jgi:hypothetical protein